MRKPYFLILFIFVANFLHAQNIETWVSEKKSVLYEKVYLHIDREMYSSGDTLWFKSYLVSGMTNKLIQGYKNIYVQLVSPGGKVVADRLLLSLNGETNGDIPIPDSIPDGQYTIRAGTRYLENFGEEGFFHKKVWILAPRNSAGDFSTNQDTSKIDVMFFPEGGNLVSETLNTVAFKAIDRSGKGIKVSGQITDDLGNEVATFETSFLGMGKFMMTPLEGRSYKAIVDGHPEFEYRFNNIKNTWIALSYRDEGTTMIITLSRNFNTTARHKYYLAAIHKGVVLFYKEIIFDGFQQALRLPKSLFAQGISKISLLDAYLNIATERLIFISDGQPNLLVLNTGKDEFMTREKVNLSIETLTDPTDTIFAALSVAVVNDNYLSQELNNQNILSYLLIDSDLKGAIESPSAYFRDDPEIKQADKLDLLMMVQGWRSYFWDEITQLVPAKLKGWDDIGLSVTGTVKRLLRDKPVVGGEVVLGPFSRNLLFEETKTDEKGRFRFDRLYLKDSAQIMLNAKNENERPNTEIFPDTIVIQPTKIDVDSMNKTVAEISIPAKFYRENYFRRSTENEFTPEAGSILMADIDVFGKRQKKDDGHLRLYGEPDKSLQITEDDFSYSDIYDYLNGKVAGLVVTGTSISIRGGGQPLFVLDGVKVDPAFEDMIANIHIQDIDKIEVLKSAGNLALFGSQGANGVVAIYTRKGDNKAEIERYIKGRILLNINGFQQPSYFYSPKFTAENVATQKPDFRPTLFWSPSVRVSEGKASAEFFTCDNLANYIIFVEGISKEGKILFGAKQFSVANFNPAVQK
jgi:hypothetical protein